MTERCPKCHRKKRAEQRPSNPELCHREGSPECRIGEWAYSRGVRDAGVHVHGTVQATCHDNDVSDEVWSLDVAAFAAAMRFLARLGRLRIERDEGHTVVGRWL